MVQIDIRADIKSAVDYLQVQSQRIIDQATVSALNRTAITVRADASRLIRETYNIKSAAVKDQIAIRKASSSNLASAVIARGKRTPLIEFVVGSVALAGLRFRVSRGRLRVAGSGFRRPTRVKVKVKHQGGAKTLQNAFIAVMPSGKIGVFERTGVYGRRGKQSLERIKQLYSVSIPQTFAQRQIMAALERVAVDRFRIEFESNLKFRSQAAK